MSLAIYDEMNVVMIRCSNTECLITELVEEQPDGYLMLRPHTYKLGVNGDNQPIIELKPLYPQGSVGEESPQQLPWHQALLEPTLPTTEIRNAYIFKIKNKWLPLAPDVQPPRNSNN